MRVTTRTPPCRCPEDAKRTVHVRRADGSYEPTTVCTQCGDAQLPHGTFITPNFPEDEPAMQSLYAAASANEGNRATLIRLTQDAIRQLQHALQHEELTPQQQLALRDALQFETETLARLQIADTEESEPAFEQPVEPMTEGQPQEQR